MPLEIRNEEKGRLVAELTAARNDVYIKIVARLIDILVEETRIENDCAGVRGVFRNQGKIEGLCQLKDYIMRGFPSINKFI